MTDLRGAWVLKVRTCQCLQAHARGGAAERVHTQVEGTGGAARASDAPVCKHDLTQPHMHARANMCHRFCMWVSLFEHSSFSCVRVSSCVHVACTCMCERTRVSVPTLDHCTVKTRTMFGGILDHTGGMRSPSRLHAFTHTQESRQQTCDRPSHGRRGGEFPGYSTCSAHGIDVQCWCSRQRQGHGSSSCERFTEWEGWTGGRYQTRDCGTLHLWSCPRPTAMPAACAILGQER